MGPLPRLLAVAGLYLAGGLIGSLLAIPPGYSSAFWMPAGLALMAVLVWGPRMWPGVLVGSFLVNLYLSAKSIGFHGPLLPFAPLALGIGVGAALQAVAGGFLIRRFVGFPTTLSRPGQSFLFLGLGGPVSCLINATAGVLLLSLTRTIPSDAVPFTWFNWWVGDSIGVVLLVPLLLLLQGRREPVWRRRWAIVGPPLLASMLGVVVLFLVTGHGENGRIRGVFGRKAEEATQRIQTVLDNHLSILRLTQALFDATGKADREGFARFTREVLARHPTIQAIEWAPRVSAAERAAFEAAIRKDPSARSGAFEIREPGATGGIVRAGDRAAYYPVCFLEPLQGNEQAAGLDLASSAARKEAMDRSLRTGEPAATDGVVLAQEKGDQAGVLVFLPVFRAGESLAGPEARERALKGFVLVVLRVGDLVERSLANLDLGQIQFQMKEREGRKQALYLNAPAVDGIRHPTLAPFQVDTSLAVGGKQWDLTFAPTLGFLDGERSPLPWLVQVVGFLLSALLGGFLLEMSVHREALAEQEAERAQADLQARSEKNFHEALEFQPIPISIAFGNDIVHCNRKFEETFGYSNQDMPTVDAWMQLAYPDPGYRSEVLQSWNEDLAYAIANDVSVPLREYLITCKDGSRKNVLISGRQVGHQFVASFMDVTDRVLAEEEKLKLHSRLQQIQKLESLGSLASGLAHDMNNVLGAILGLASANVETQPEGSPARRAFDTIIKAATRGGETVKNLLSFARQSPAESRHLDLNRVLREQVGLLERTVLARVRLELDLDPDLRPIIGDASALSLAFMNLCVNAVDAMPEDGTLTLRTRNADRDWIEVRVEDTGAGMPREVLEKALDPFFTTKEVGKGTGLGLSMVFSTVKAHRGLMEIHSEPGRGTCVKLRFPAEAPALQAPEPAAEARPGSPGKGRNVLLVDDDELIQSSVLAILEALGHHGTGVSCGEEALERLAAGLAPDVVILDMNMPGLGGAGTLPRLRALRPTLPVLLATGRVDQSATNLVAAHAHVTLLSKPYGMKELQLRLDALDQAP